MERGNGTHPRWSSGELVSFNRLLGLLLYHMRQTGNVQKYDPSFYSTLGKPLSPMLLPLDIPLSRYKVGGFACVQRLVSGHDSDRGLQHEEDNEGEDDAESVGHWGTAEVVLCT